MSLVDKPVSHLNFSPPECRAYSLSPSQRFGASAAAQETIGGAPTLDEFTNPLRFHQTSPHVRRHLPILPDLMAQG